MEFVNTFSVIDLLGQFGKDPGPPGPPARLDKGSQAPSDTDGLTGLLGGFVGSKDDAPPPSSTLDRDTGNEEHYLAVATSPPAGAAIAPGESGTTGSAGTPSRTTTPGPPPRPSAGAKAAAASAPSAPAALPCVADVSGSPWRSGATGTRIPSARTS